MNESQDSSGTPEGGPPAPAPQSFRVQQHLQPGVTPTFEILDEYGVVTIIDNLAVQTADPAVFRALAEIFGDAARELAQEIGEAGKPEATS